MQTQRPLQRIPNNAVPRSELLQVAKSLRQATAPVATPPCRARLGALTPPATPTPTWVSSGRVPRTARAPKKSPSPPTTKPETQNHGTAVKNWQRLLIGGGKILAGIGILSSFFLSFTNPVMAIVETFARLALKNLIPAVMYMMTSGLRDVLASFTQVNPVVQVLADIAAVTLDVIGVVSNIINLTSFVKSMSVMGTFSKGLSRLAEDAQTFIKAGGSTKAIGPLTTMRFTTLGANVGANLLGIDQLSNDWSTLSSDWNTLPR